MKKQFNHISKSCLVRQFVVLLAFGLISTASFSSPFQRIISFGDSLADTGNLFEDSFGTAPPPDQYYQGRASDGIVWVEYLADDLNIELVDYAYFGAMTNDSNFNDGKFPSWLILDGLADEVDQFLADLGDGKVSNRDLFTLIIGANDFFSYMATSDPSVWVPESIGNITTEITRLAEAGARNMVVVNVPDLSVTPALIFDPTEPDLIAVKGLVDYYNELLAYSLDQIESQYKCNIVIVDMFGVLNDIVANPTAFGLLNVIIPASYDELIPAEYSLFWDGVHPTTVGHRILADAALDAILRDYVPGKAIGISANKPGWVKR